MGDLAFVMGLDAEDPGSAVRGIAARTSSICRERRDMSVVIYIVLTVAIFALLGLVQKLVERL